MIHQSALSRSSYRVWLAFLALAIAAPAAASNEAAVPAHREPSHHLVFQNQFVRILDIRVPAGRVTKYHVHADPLVTVSVQDAQTRSQLFGEAPGKVMPRGDVPIVGDNWDEKLPYTHRVANVDTVPFHRIGAEWLGPAGGGCSDLQPPGGYELNRESRFARVYEARLGPGEATPRHTHSCPGLTVQGTSGRLLNSGGRPAAQGGSGAGYWFWRDAGHDHVLRNTSNQAITVFEIDWR